MSYTSRLVNYVEPYYIDGIAKTAIWTEVNTNLQKNDKVFIINGYYDSEVFIRKGKWTKNADGYRVLLVDRCKVVLDIEWETGMFAGLTQTYREDTYDNFLKVHNIRSQREFDYINKIYIDSYTASRYSKFEKNLTNNFIYSDRSWTGATGLGANSGIATTKSIWARQGATWVNVTSQFVNNTFSFSTAYSTAGLTNNGRIYVIGEDFNYGDILLKERNIYKWTGSASWLIDTEYKQPILSKLYFKQGVFKGTFNDGVFGTYLKSEVWSGTPSVWNSGFLVNSIWQSGEMKSKSTVYEPSYYTTLINGKPVQTTDFSNNKGYGYNYVIDSDIKEATIKNGNFINTNIGVYDTGLTAIDDYFGITNSYLLTLDGGLYNYCDINNSKLNNSTTLDSIVKNSYLDASRTFNSQISESYLTNGEFSASEASINVLGADLSSYLTSSTSATFSTIKSILKLYIDDKDIHRLDNLDSFFITKLNKEWILTRLDSDQKVYLPLEGKYILDTFFDFKVNLVNQECVATLKSKFDNKNITVVDFNGTTYYNTSETNSNNFASIDIDLSNYLGFYRYQGQFVYLNQSYIDKTVVNNLFKGTSITNSDFRDGVIKNTTWTSGSHQNYSSNIIQWENDALKISKYSTDEIEISLTASRPTINDNLLRKGSYVWLDAIQHTDGVTTKSLTDVYQVSTYSTDKLILRSQGLTSVSVTGTYSLVGGKKPTYISVHKLLIENSIVRKGLFVRNLFRNTTFEDTEFNSNDRELANNNISKSRFINHYFVNSASQSNTIKSGLFHNSHFLNVDWTSGIADNSVWDGPEFKGGVFNYGIWLGGTFSGGIFQNSRGITYSREDYTAETTYYRNWSKGTFNGGEVYNSVWLNGTFNLGKFWGSDWYGGIWNNGILGDNRLPTSRTTMAKLLNIGTGATHTLWYNGMVEGAEVGGQGFIDWYDGQFNAGIFSASYSAATYSVWHNGKFNEGNFTGLAKWKNGNFNGGKFTSHYGWTLSNSTLAKDYAWEFGDFNGGQFGEESTGTNSTWFDGHFYGGLFKGRVWNKGIFLGGNFEGSGTTSVISNTSNFSESFTQSYWGLWRSGTVTEQKHKADPTYVVPPFNGLIGTPIPTLTANLKNMLWVSGNFNHPAGEIINSAWLKGKFIYGKFTDGVFNPYVRRDWWDNSFGTYSAFNFDLANCIWQNGQFKGVFYISDWLNGTFLGGTMSGARWYDGIWSFGNASNIYWENGTWKNGNWDGSPFDLTTLTFTQSEHTMNPGMKRDILMRVANIHQDGKVHVINAFTGSFTENIFESWTFSNTSASLSDWIANNNYYYLDYGRPSEPGIVVIDNQFNIPSLANTTTIAVTSSVTELDEYRVYIYSGYIFVTASSTDTVSTIANRLVDRINLGVLSPIVNFEQWTPSGYIIKQLTWRQLDGKFDVSLPYAETTSGGQFFVQVPLDTYAYVQAFSGFQGSTIYSPSEKIYALIDDGSGLTASIFTQSGIQHTIKLNVYNYFGRTDFLVSFQGNVYRETLLTTGPKTLNYSFVTSDVKDDTDTTLYVERLAYEEPDNSSFEVQDLEINKLESFYDTINNTLYQFATYSLPFVYGPTGSTMSLPGRLLTGLITNNEAVSIKYGNGAFKYGLWENGYWNNGWHASWNSEREYFLFKDVVTGGFVEASTNLWIVQLQALTNTNGIEIGNRVSIGNLVFIDVNENRRLIRSWFRVINKTIDKITVEINVNFAVRRIERDSSLHLIYVSKNIWQSGIFHNGYFKGIWNYGLFRGYPYITKMDATHWIDGIFDGGHFLSTKSFYLNQGLSQSYNNGLIQNFIFRDNNIANAGEFKYNSWVDTNYYTQSMSNILRDNLKYDNNWGVILSSGNLKGYPSEDVLSSTSIFRNSFDTEKKYLSLGSKYKVYNDFIKLDSFFTYPFNTDGQPGVEEFLSKGWTFSNKSMSIYSNSRGGDENVLKVDYITESYSNVGVKFVQTKKISYSNRNVSIGKFPIPSAGPNLVAGILGDFASQKDGINGYYVKIDGVLMSRNVFSNIAYIYTDTSTPSSIHWPLRPQVSGVAKLATNIDVYRHNLVGYVNQTTGNTLTGFDTFVDGTVLNERRIYMIDLFNPDSTDTAYGGYNVSGLVENEIFDHTNKPSNVVNGIPWSHKVWKSVTDTRVKINATVPFYFSADEFGKERGGWSIFKLIGVVEKMTPVTGRPNSEEYWTYLTSTKLEFYGNSLWYGVQGGFFFDKEACLIGFDSTRGSVDGQLYIKGFETNIAKGDLLRFRLYWIDIRKSFAATNNNNRRGPGFMNLIIGKVDTSDNVDIQNTQLVTPINHYTENNHGFFEIIDLSTYINTNTNILDNTKTRRIDRLRYSVVDFDLAEKPNWTIQGTSSNSVGDGALPNIFLLNSDYPSNLPGSFSTVINHGESVGNKKEYFYNRKALNLFFKSAYAFTAAFSKLQFYETDMIPFFRYTDDSAVNQEVQSPYYGSAPEVPIAEGSLSLDTISYTSPFVGDVPIRGQVIVPGGAGSSTPGDSTPGDSTPGSIVTYNVNYSFINNSFAGINEFTSYYRIQEYTPANDLVRTLDLDLSFETISSSSFAVTSGNRLDIFVVATYSVVPASNRVAIFIQRDDSVIDVNLESSPVATISSLSTSYTPSRDISITLTADTDEPTYYYYGRQYECLFGGSGQPRILKSAYAIPANWFACASGENAPAALYQIGSAIPSIPRPTHYAVISAYGEVCETVQSSCF
jgi:hypothetical protein